MISRRALLTCLAAGTAAGQSAQWTGVVGDAGYGASVGGTMQGDALLLRHEAGGAQTLHRWAWSERLREGAGGDAAVRLAALGAAATDPLVPVRDGPFWQDPIRWKLWREGATVHAIDNSLRRQSLRLDGPATLVRPALQRAGGDVGVFALAAHGRHVDQLSLPRDAGGQGRVLRRIDLPLAAAQACVAFGTDGRLAFGLSAQAADDIELLIEDGASLLRASVAGLQALSRPALAIDAEGLRLALVAQGGEGAGLVVWRAGRQAQFRLLAKVARPAAAAVVFGHAGKPIAFALDAEGRGLRLEEGAAPEELRLPAKPVMPLVLVPGTRGAWLLCCDPVSGPVMAAV